ncbi:MAG: winged helix-turn-helix domain-containing protein [Xanthomonadales bacterium]|nr:winged helix-turn-helix domain-containing protein [Xanthomonadales bacterium]
MENFSDQIITTGEFQINPQTGEVSFESKKVRFGPVNMKVLLILVKHEGDVVTRKELFDSVWRNQIVNDDVLTRCISDLRQSLTKLSNNKHLIKTVPKKGYKWSIQNTESKKKIVPHKKWFAPILIIFSGMLFFAFLFVWIINMLNSRDYTHMILVPLEYEKQSALIKDSIEESLIRNSLQTETLRFFSRAVSQQKENSFYSQVTKELSARWLIEGKVRFHNNKYKIILRLVDVKTMLVLFSKTTVSSGDNVEIDVFVGEFLHYVESL